MLLLSVPACLVIDLPRTCLPYFRDYQFRHGQAKQLGLSGMAAPCDFVLNMFGAMLSGPKTLVDLVAAKAILFLLCAHVVGSFGRKVRAQSFDAIRRLVLSKGAFS